VKIQAFYRGYNQRRLFKQMKRENLAVIAERILNEKGYRGLTWIGAEEQWRVEVKSPDRLVGMYEDAHEAARAYDRYVVKNKLYKQLNFPCKMCVKGSFKPEGHRGRHTSRKHAEKIAKSASNFERSQKLKVWCVNAVAAVSRKRKRMSRVAASQSTLQHGRRAAQKGKQSVTCSLVQLSENALRATHPARNDRPMGLSTQDCENDFDESTEQGDEPRCMFCEKIMYRRFGSGIFCSRVCCSKWNVVAQRLGGAEKVKANTEMNEDIRISKLKPFQALQNHHSPRKLSKYTGVKWHTTLNRWEVVVEHKSKKGYGGRFTDEEEAARAYDRIVIEQKLGKPLNFSTNGDEPRCNDEPWCRESSSKRQKRSCLIKRGENCRPVYRTSVDSTDEFEGGHVSRNTRRSRAGRNSDIGLNQKSFVELMCECNGRWYQAREEKRIPRNSPKFIKVSFTREEASIFVPIEEEHERLKPIHPNGSKVIFYGGPSEDKSGFGSDIANASTTRTKTPRRGVVRGHNILDNGEVSFCVTEACNPEVSWEIFEKDILDLENLIGHFFFRSPCSSANECHGAITRKLSSDTWEVMHIDGEIGKIRTSDFMGKENSEIFFVRPGGLRAHLRTTLREKIVEENLTSEYEEMLSKWELFEYADSIAEADPTTGMKTRGS
jgi:hypothetical protein